MNKRRIIRRKGHIFICMEHYLDMAKTIDADHVQMLLQTLH